MNIHDNLLVLTANGSVDGFDVGNCTEKEDVAEVLESWQWEAPWTTTGCQNKFAV